MMIEKLQPGRISGGLSRERISTLLESLSAAPESQSYDARAVSMGELRELVRVYALMQDLDESERQETELDTMRRSVRSMTTALEVVAGDSDRPLAVAVRQLLVNHQNRMKRWESSR